MVPEGTNKSRLYLSAVETTERSYVSDRTRFFLFIIPLPGGGGKEASQIKEGEKVVQDKVFYRKFFDFICEQVQEIESCKLPQQEITAVTAPVSQPAVSVPASAPVVATPVPATPVPEAQPAVETQPPAPAAAVPEPATSSAPASTPAPSEEKAP
jgi:hypothetical protein